MHKIDDDIGFHTNKISIRVSMQRHRVMVFASIVPQSDVLAYLVSTYRLFTCIATQGMKIFGDQHTFIAEAPPTSGAITCT